MWHKIIRKLTMLSAKLSKINEHPYKLPIKGYQETVIFAFN